MNASSRRDFLKKTAYVAPLILTMNVSLAAAQVGSARANPTYDLPGHPIEIGSARTNPTHELPGRRIGWSHNSSWSRWWNRR